MAARTVRLIVGIRRVVPSHPLAASVFACTRVRWIFCRYAAHMKGGFRGKEGGGKERARKKTRALAGPKGCSRLLIRNRARARWKRMNERGRTFRSCFHFFSTFSSVPRTSVLPLLRGLPYFIRVWAPRSLLSVDAGSEISCLPAIALFSHRIGPAPKNYLLR